MRNKNVSTQIYEGAVSLQKQLMAANARIAQLEEALTCAGEDMESQGMDTSAVMRAFAEASDIWLIEHDKAVEVKVLEVVSDRIKNYTIEEARIRVSDMIESRKQR